ncbi:hypothetical protein M885DRAFT_562106 [Pelagophyceae sp. CCMP2097]|nr:hypothetical protein M885DRAFT_562106 [Pelagophyceae sp. CCMP2097]
MGRRKGFRLRLVLAAALSAASAANWAPQLEGGQEEFVEGAHLVWQAPRGKPAAILALFHRGGRSAGSWWDKSPSCPSCSGLPEEKRIVSSALARGFAAVATSSADTVMRRWDVHDGPGVASGLASLLAQRGWQGLPLYAVGVGCGAGFAATLLPQSLPPGLLRGLHLQLMADQPFKATLQRPFKGKGLAMLHTPPAKCIVMLHMARDESVARAAAAIRRSWETGGARVLEQRAVPQPMRESFFCESISAVSCGESSALVGALLVAGYISSGGFLLADPQRSAWRSVVSAPVGRRGPQELGMLRALTRDRLEVGRSPIAQEMHRAYALNEVTAEFMNETLAFFLASRENVN